MFDDKPNIFSSPEFKSFNIFGRAPISGIETLEDFSNASVIFLVTQLSEHHAGIEKCIRETLELDGDAYAVQISGSPYHYTRLGRAQCGYRIAMSIHPDMASGKPKVIQRVGRLPRAQH